mgnify:CR=1 FL=1
MSFNHEDEEVPRRNRGDEQPHATDGTALTPAGRCGGGFAPPWPEYGTRRACAPASVLQPWQAGVTPPSASTEPPHDPSWSFLSFVVKPFPAT